MVDNFSNCFTVTNFYLDRISGTHTYIKRRVVHEVAYGDPNDFVHEREYRIMNSDGSSYFPHKDLNHYTLNEPEELEIDVLMDGKVQERLLEDSKGYIASKDRVQKIKYYVCGNIIYLRFTFVNIFIVWLYCTLVCCSIWKTANS